jgi:glutaredoxin-related protein
MKGVPGAPQCGFSSMVCKVLDSYGELQFRNLVQILFFPRDFFFLFFSVKGTNPMSNQNETLFRGFVALIGLLGMGELAEVKYKSRDVLADQELREGIKSFRYCKT